MKARYLLYSSILLITGCAGRLALRYNYSGYFNQYGESANQQLLLNLARLRHDEPPYFVQLGQINSQFTFNTSAGFSPSYARITHPQAASGLVQYNTGFGGNFGAGAIESPTFQFVPLNGAAFAKVITEAISPDLFYSFYDQGFHGDALARTMVAYIKFPSGPNSYTIYRNQPRDPTYTNFLIFCQGLHIAQRSSALLAEKTSSEEATVYNNVQLGDAVAAKSAALHVKNDSKDPNKYVVSSSKDQWKLKPAANNLPMFESEVQDALRNGKLELQMRTFIATAYGVAKEQYYFAQSVTNNPLKLNFVDPAKLVVELSPSIKTLALEPFQVKPIITIHYPQGVPSNFTKLAEVKHDGETYIIGDDESSQTALTNSPSVSNCSVFSLISYLFAGTAIDPGKLPVQQLIQVR
jgi:hypothetical protein